LLVNVQQAMEDDAWACNACTLLNEALLQECAACGAERPMQRAAVDLSAAFQAPDGDAVPAESPSLELALELSRADSAQDPKFGSVLLAEAIRKQGIYFEAQEPGSETCAQNSLNNLVQEYKFTLAHLGQAEFHRNDSLCFGGADIPITPATSTRNNGVPTGFFDIEAVKKAASEQGIQVVDIEPKASYLESEVYTFVSEGDSGGCSWFKGFLVYDSRPGHARHFYVIVPRPGKQFALLNSLEEDKGEQNRILTDEELWQFYEYHAGDFQSWAYRWYPVVSPSLAAEALSSTLKAEDAQWSISAERAQHICQACRWSITPASQRLLEHDVKRVHQQLCAGRLQLSRTTVHDMLEAVEWDGKAAAERLADTLRKQAEAPMPEDRAVKCALNTTDWYVDRAVAVLELEASPEKFEQMRDVLKEVDWSIDKARMVLHVLEVARESVELDNDVAIHLLGECSWEIIDVPKVAVVQKTYPGCPVPIIRKVLHRNEGDSHAAIEMLKDFQERVASNVRKCSKSISGPFVVDLLDDEVVAIVSTSLEQGDWNPPVVLEHARQLTDFIISTSVICGKLHAANVPAASIIWAINELGGAATPESAARFLFGEADPLPDLRAPPPTRSEVAPAAKAKASASAKNVGRGAAGGGAGRGGKRQKERRESDDNDSGCVVA